MRLAFVTTTRYPHMGGQSTHIGDLTRGLRSAGHEVEHVSLADLGDAFVKWIVMRPGYALDKLRMGWRLQWTTPVVRALLGSRLAKRHKAKPFDAILAQDPLAWHLARAALPKDVPITLTVHGYLVHEHLADKTLVPGATEKWLEGLEREAYAGADRIVTVDTRIKDHVVAWGGRPDRITVLKNFVDASKFTPTGDVWQGWEGKRVLLCPRRIVPKNGVRYAAEAAKVLGDGYVVVIAGDGPDRAAVEAVGAPNAPILGPIPHDRLPSLYRRADAILIPSVHEKGVEEATSISALEGMSAGRPVIASSIGGLKELIRDGDNGLLVPERDAQAIGQAARRLAGDPALAKRLGDAAREDVLRNYSLQARVEDYLAVVRAALPA